MARGIDADVLAEHLGASRIYYFDIVHDYPEIGGVVEFSKILYRELKNSYGPELVSVRSLADELRLPDARLSYLYRERLAAERLAERDPDAVFFYPNFQSPIPGRARAGGPRVVNVIHDVQFAYLPSLFNESVRQELFETFTEARDNADEIIFISEAARSQFLEKIGTPRSGRVIYNPVAVRKIRPLVAPGTHRYLLAPIHHHPHKNFSGLLNFFAELASRDQSIELVMTGQGDARVMALARSLPAEIRNRVRHLGYVERRQLDALYGGAAAFVSLSRFEGFNMSAAEAALHGVPLLLSDLPVHRELYSREACFLDPDRPSVDSALDYLRRRADEPAPIWRFEQACRPVCAGKAYAAALRAFPEARASAARHFTRRQPVARMQFVSATTRLLACTMMAGVTMGPLMLAAPSAHADGGAGGGMVSRSPNPSPPPNFVLKLMPGFSGGAGYTGESGGSAASGDSLSVYYGGGGGGAGGGQGGEGGNTACRPEICIGYTRPAGGAGGTAIHMDGEDGENVGNRAGSGGGGGGGGGLHGNGFSGVLTNTDLRGGNGGNGGDGPTGGGPGTAGGGGAGGYGALITATGAMNNSARITGGNGGAGGDTVTSSSQGGFGGDGGLGLYFVNPGAVLTNTGSIYGGNGGAAGIAPPTSGAMAEIDNTAGNGAGGVGVAGIGLTLINGGTITGGMSGDGLTQANAVTFQGGDNTLTFLNATSGLNGNIALENEAVLTFDQPTDATLDNLIVGTGMLRKQGAGTLTMAGNNSAFSGAMSVSGGRLAISGALGGAVNVLDGGTLAGTGTTGTVTVLAGGVLAPGNAIGALTVAGDVTLAPGGILEAELAADGSADLLSASGTVTVGGAELQLVLVDTDADYRDGQTYRLIAASGIDGSFATVTTTSIFLNGTVNYLADSVTVEVKAMPRALVTAAETPNQRSTAAALDSLPATEPSLGLYDALLLLPSEDAARSAFDALSGVINATSQSAFVTGSALMRNGLTDRMRNAQGGVGATSNNAGTATQYAEEPAAGAAFDALAPAEAGGGPTFWLSGDGNWTDADGNGNAAGYTGSAGGVLAGVDFMFGDGFLVGVAGGYGASEITVSGGGGKADSNNWSLALYGAGGWGDFALRGGLGYTWHDVSSTRTVAFTGFANTLTADYDAATFQAFGEAAYRFETGFAAFEPFAGLSYVGFHQDGFAETGGAAALSVSAADMDTTFTTIGARAERDFALGSTKATLSGTLGWQHAFGDITPLAAMAFSGSDSFSVAGTPIARNTAVVEAGLSLKLAPHAEFGIGYAGQFGDGVTQNGVRAGLKVRF